MDGNQQNNPQHEGIISKASTMNTEFQEPTELNKFPQTFVLHGKTCEGDDFNKGASVTRKKPDSKVVVSYVDEDGILYRTGIRAGDILEVVNSIDVRLLDLQDIVTVISTLDAFHFILRRDTLNGREKYRYIHVGFNTGYVEREGESRQVDLKLLSAHVGVTRDAEDLYYAVEFNKPGVFRKTNTLTVKVRVDVDGNNVRFMNTNQGDSLVQFTAGSVNLTQFVYVNDQTHATAVVLCPTRAKCIKANEDNKLLVGELGKLKNSYLRRHLNDRFLMQRSVNTKLVKFESRYNQGYYVTVNKDGCNGVYSCIMSDSGTQEMKIIRVKKP